MTRLIEAHDLELYAIHTGAFYETHKQLVIRPVEEWQAHLLNTVVPHYCREIEPVRVDALTLSRVADSLLEYYQRHQQEWQTTVMKQVARERKAPANITAPSADALLFAQRVLQDTAGQQFVALIGNPVDGFAVVGPFADSQDAVDFLDASDAEGWVVPLRQPA